MPLHLGDDLESGLPKESNVGRVRAKLGQKTKVCLPTGSREGNVGNDALHVIGLHGPGD